MAGKDEVKVLQAWVSMFGMRVLIALEEKGVVYEYQEESTQNKSQLLLESNPVYKKVPVLIHNGKPVCESLIIVQYIDDVWGSQNKSFLPETPYERAIARFWADYVDKKFYDAAVGILKSPPGEARQQATVDLRDSFITLDKALQEVACGKPFFGGDNVGFVDIAFAPFICWFHAIEVLGNFKLPDEKQCPTLRAWINEVCEQSSVKKCLQDPEKVLEYAKSVRTFVLGSPE
eukprot:c26348_g2_i1 orf=287-982(+)